MNGEESVPEEETIEESEQDLRSQIADHVDNLPDFTRTMYRATSVLAGLSLLVPVGFFAWALYVTISGRENDGFTIAVWWLAFAASVGIPPIFGGLTTIIARADPLLVLPRQKGKLKTGRKAVWQGVVLTSAGLFMSAFWGLWSYTISLRDIDRMMPYIQTLGTVIGVGVAIAVAASLLRQFTRSR